MARVCVIDVAGLSRRLLDRVGGLWMDSLVSPPRPMRATFPVVSASVQTSMTTGCPPGEHGVVAGGIFRRQCRAFSLDERSNTLLSKKRFWHARRLPRRPTVSLLFWSNPLAGAADAVIGAETYGPISAFIAEQPRGLYGQLAADLGPFDPRWVRGPRASARAGRWIAAAAAGVWRRLRSDLQWVCLPGVNFELTRHGPLSPQAEQAVRTADELAHGLAEAVLADGGQVLLLSDGGYVPVRRAVYPNVALRQAGLLKLRPTDAGTVLDMDASRAFALVDHQVAHVYCEGQEAARQAEAALAGLEGVAAVLPREQSFCPGLGRDRAGERVVLAEGDAWLAYPWWGPEEQAPDLAYQTDTPGKCGYDPCELFAAAPAGEIQAGSGGGLDASGRIDPDPARVRASRGLLDIPPEDQCVLGATCPLESRPEAVTDLPGAVLSLLFGRGGGGAA